MARRMLVSLVVGIVLASTQSARADWDARVVARVGGTASWSSSSVHARLGQSVELAVVTIDPTGRLLSDVSPVAIGRRPARPVDGPLPTGARVSWERIESRMQHVERPSPNRGDPTFSNNVLYGPRHGAWLGYDRLEYTSAPAMPWAGTAARDLASIVVRAAHPSRSELDRHGGAGSLWMAAEVTLADGTRIRTPDARHVDRFGLARDVMRVSFRQGDDFLGWLSTYFNVPNVFGSNGPTDVNHQTERYTGADCADVLVGAMRASGRRDLAYASVASIGRYTRPTTPALVMASDGRVHEPDGGEARMLRWGEEVRPGDLLAIDYLSAGRMLPRAWDHIGALVEDRGPSGPDGVLGPEDVLRHVTAWGLQDRPLGEGLPIGIRVWRWREGRVPARRAARALAEPSHR